MRSWLPATWCTLALTAREERHALAVAAKVGLAVLVLDVVAQVEHQLGTDHVVHPVDERPREPWGLGRELAELAVVACFFSEVQVGHQRKNKVVRQDEPLGRAGYESESPGHAYRIG